MRGSSAGRWNCLPGGRVRRWYRRNATPWPVLAQEAAAVVAHLPTVLAPVLFGVRRAYRAWVHWDDEELLCRTEREGFAVSRYWNTAVCLVGVVLIGPGSRHPWPGIGAGLALWGLFNALVTVAVLVSAGRFARVHAGRHPGEDADSPHAQRLRQRYWDRALWDAYFARTGLTRKDVRRRRRRNEPLPDEQHDEHDDSGTENE